MSEGAAPVSTTRAPVPQGALPSDEARRHAASTGTWLSLWARTLGDAEAVISPTGNRSFRELSANTNRLARAFRAAGLRPGDAVALVCGNRPAFVESVQACLQAGLRYTPVNWHLTAHEVAYVVQDCGAKAVLADADYAYVMRDVRVRCPQVALWLVVGGAVTGFDDYETILAQHDPSELTDPVLGCRMLYTSGTTGYPKGVVRPPNYSTHLEALTTAPKYRAGSGQLNLCTGPYYHGGPLSFSLLAPLSAGVGVVIMERFDAEEALSLIAKHRVTHTHMVPIMFHRLLRLPEEVRARYDVSSMQYLLHGAAACPIETKRAMLSWFGPVLWEYFAATEGSGASVGSAEWLKRPGTVGRPPTPDHLRILDDEGRECPAGVAGRVHIKRGDEDFEYWNDPEKTARARRGGYFTVGDIGFLDEDGFLFITDRDANLIVSGGVNIYPAEVEAVLLTHPAVRDVAVIGVPNAEWGEEVKAVVEWAPAATRDESATSADAGAGADRARTAAMAALSAELIAYCRARVAHFKCPKSVDIVEHLPRLDNGKLYRDKLRAAYRGDAP
ncbi:MAG: AMP-binding protein [Myxococcales bacterium]|nr:AMP-binding protein [Myxococcales bacterium]